VKLLSTIKLACCGGVLGAVYGIIEVLRITSMDADSDLGLKIADMLGSALGELFSSPLQLVLGISAGACRSRTIAA